MIKLKALLKLIKAYQPIKLITPDKETIIPSYSGLEDYENCIVSEICTYYPSDDDNSIVIKLERLDV